MTATRLKKGSRAGARKKRRLYFLLTSLLVLGLAVALVLNALKSSIRLFYDPTEVVEKGISPGQDFRIGGLVKTGSFKSREVGDIEVNTFKVTDGNKSVAVIYKGLLPDLFREGQGVVAEGAMNKSGVFVATQVLAKHDENYMPKDVVDSLKKRGEWKKYIASKDKDKGKAL